MPEDTHKEYIGGREILNTACRVADVLPRLIDDLKEATEEVFEAQWEDSNVSITRLQTIIEEADHQDQAGRRAKAVLMFIREALLGVRTACALAIREMRLVGSR